MEFTDANFDAEVLKAKGVVLVDFFATWCGPCQMQGPIVDELAKDLEKEEDIKVGKLDVDKNPEAAEKYGVMSIPTLIIFKNGEPVETLTGVQNKDILMEKLNSKK